MVEDACVAVWWMALWRFLLWGLRLVLVMVGWRGLSSGQAVWCAEVCCGFEHCLLHKSPLGLRYEDELDCVVYEVVEGKYHAAAEFLLRGTRTFADMSHS